jgi:hypothetical protein
MRYLPRSLALATALALSTTLAPVAAHAQQAKGLGDWSVVGSEINTGKPFEDVQAGWPNVNFGYTFNLGKTSDIGLRFGLLYGVEGTTSTQFGIGLWAPIRFQLSRSEKFNLIFHVDPGVRLYFAGSTCVAGTDICANTSKTQFGFTFPVGVVGGFPVGHNLEIGGGLDLNLALAVTSPVNFTPSRGHSNTWTYSASPLRVQRPLNLTGLNLEAYFAYSATGIFALFMIHSPWLPTCLPL